jgi:histidine triad (HIT) family protein
MSYTYDSQNIFAKILRGEIPNSTVAETDHSLAFKDINPGAPHHVLVIPKGAYVNFDHFSGAASDTEILDFYRLAGKITNDLGISPDGGLGYRVIGNSGEHGVQDVPHFHLHILGGHSMGRMLQK